MLCSSGGIFAGVPLVLGLKSRDWMRRDWRGFITVSSFAGKQEKPEARVIIVEYLMIYLLKDNL